MNDSVTAIILCGGQGTRMQGQDKGLVKFKNKPMIEHVIERLKPQVESIVISCNRNMTIYQRYGLVVEDEVKDYSGPLRGILSAYTHLTSPYVIVVPCDMPYLPLNLVSRLGKYIDSAEVVCSHDGLQQQSLVFMAKTEVIATIEGNLGAGKRSVRTWLADRQTIDVDFSGQSETFPNKAFPNKAFPNKAFLNINDENTLREES